MKYLFFLVFASILHANPLICAYESILHVKENTVYFKDGSKLLYDDKKVKQNPLLNADIEDTLALSYPYLKSLHVKPSNDTGRVRNEEFLKKLYGKDKKHIQKNLVKIKWLPKYTKLSLSFNSKQGAAKALQKISNELEKLSLKYIKFLDKPSGTFAYRKIAKTDRLSPHSFGIAIDINVNYADYWQWSKDKVYKNQIPQKIVEIFEKNGFIWGGRWLHFDTMHFEYRPELTCKKRKNMLK
ncbi:MAG: M15 family metallopeptidase [Campylobacteraceae bacterium]|nr:M15 family metallopeptidase [Campylobacteraceae bacterium]